MYRMEFIRFGCYERAEKREAKSRRENAKKAKASADRLFPGEKWKTIEIGIFLSPNRAIGKKSNYTDEIRDARILQKSGNTVYLTPDGSRQIGKKYDAIVNGLKMEFKNVVGGADALQKRFFESRSQAPNVFINLEKSRLKRKEIIATLYGARNNPKFPKNTGNNGGMIILNIRGMDRLIYVKVDDLLAPK